MVQKRNSQKTGVIVYPNVILGENVVLNEGVILGSPDKNARPTVIGNNSIIREYSVIYEGVTIGNNFQTGAHVLIRENNTLGSNVVVWHASTLNPGNYIKDYCRIHAQCFVEEVTMEEYIFLAPGVICANDPHPTNPPTRSCMKGATLKRGAIIGANVTLLPHITIGERAVVGAGAVVTKDVPKAEVWVGNPAHFLKRVDDVVCKRKPGIHYPFRTDL